MKTKFSYTVIPCKSAMHHIQSRFLPYHYDLNIYRGCEHQCVYCFAQYSHQYLEDKDFFHHIYIKNEVVKHFETELKRKSWKREVVNLGGVTDSYQPAEKEYKRMPDILSLLIQYKTPAIISTKSSLILRDIELLQQLDKVAGVQIAVTVTTLDQKLADHLEPGASSIKERLYTIQKLKEAGLTVGWHFMPIIPYLTATHSQLEAVFQTMGTLQVDYMIAGILNLRGPTRKHFLDFVKDTYPVQAPKITKLYTDKSLRTAYKKQLEIFVSSLSKKYNISRNYLKYVPKVEDNLEKQLSFFS